MSKPLFQLAIGDKNLSSWSMRAWLAAKVSKLPFEEIMIGLDRPETAEALKQTSPSMRVPCLIDADLRIWDSLAICEYLAELAPDQTLWPIVPHQRAIARSMTAEMHSGFQSMRAQLSMDIRLRTEIRHLQPQTIADIRRVLSLWGQGLSRSKGPFLFGSFGIVDAFYAPVVFRFLSYGIRIESPSIQTYMKAVQDHPPVREWSDAALKEEPHPILF